MAKLTTVAEAAPNGSNEMSYSSSLANKAKALVILPSEGTSADTPPANDNVTLDVRLANRDALAALPQAVPVAATLDV